MCAEQEVQVFHDEAAIFADAEKQEIPADTGPEQRTRLRLPDLFADQIIDADGCENQRDVSRIPISVKRHARDRQPSGRRAGESFRSEREEDREGHGQEDEQKLVAVKKQGVGKAGAVVRSAGIA